MTSDVMVGVAVAALGRALLESLWQGALVVGVTALVLRALRSPAARYTLACMALVVMVSAWIATAARTAAELRPQTSVATAGAPAPPVLLGPGVFDFSPAIQPLSPAVMEGRATDVAWTARLDSWARAAVPLWLAGVGLLSLRFSIGWLLLVRMRRLAHAPIPAELAARVAGLAHRMRVSRVVRVASTAAMPVPAVIGWLRPMLLLPASALTGLTPAQLDAVIAHELAHVRRHDFAVNLLQSAAETLLFYHPACWWLSRRIRAEREYCCDDVAVAVCGDRLTYAEALTELEALRQPRLVLAATDGPLLERVRRLVAPPPVRTATPVWLAVAVPLCALALIASTATFSRAATQDPVEQSRVPGEGRQVSADRGVVQGRVIDALSGRPLQGARVQVMGGPDFGSLTTDDDGRYELELRPGRYRVTVNANGYATGFHGPQGGRGGQTIVDVQPGRLTTGIDVRMQASGRISGRILDDRGQPLAGVELELMPAVSAMALGGPRAEYARTDADGSYRVELMPGEYVIRAYVDGATRPARNTALLYLSTYYPGVRAREEAQAFRIESGAEQYDVSFALAVGQPVRIAGVVADPAGGDLADVRVSLRNFGADGSNREIAVTVDRNGSFDARDLAPGTYMVAVLDQRNPGRWAGTARQIVADGDTTDLDLRAVPTSTVVGRMVRGPRSAGQPDLTQARIGFVMWSPETRMNGGAFDVEDDGTFTGILPGGRLLLNVTSLPPGWAVRSMRLDNSEVFGVPIDVAPGRHELEVVIDDVPASVRGLVVDRRGTPLGGYTVILFPEDETLWHAGSPFIQAAGSYQDGRFELRSLPAGDYLAVAIERAPFIALLDPQRLAHLQPIATRLTVLDGEQKTISIRASPTPDAVVAR